MCYVMPNISNQTLSPVAKNQNIILYTCNKATLGNLEILMYMYYHWTAFQYQIHFIFFLIRITNSLIPKSYSKFHNTPENQRVIIMLLLWAGIQGCILFCLITFWWKAALDVRTIYIQWQGPMKHLYVLLLCCG